MKRLVYVFGVLLFFWSNSYAQPSLSPLAPSLIKINDIQIVGNRYVSKNRITQAISLTKGESYYSPFIQREIGLSIRELYELGWFSDIKVSSKGFGNSVDLIYEVKLFPIIAEVRYEGITFLVRQIFEETIC